MTIVFYISGHGFGHATRDLEVIRHLQQSRPDIRIVVRSQVPRWFLDRSARAAIEVQPCEADTGMTQIDSLQLDERRTASDANEFYATFEARVAAEARTLTALAASVVVGDVPPLAFAAADRAGIASIVLANFTWDWIYAAYAIFRSEAADVLRTIGDAYSRATLALRLPFAGGFTTIPTIRDVPLVARRSRRSRMENRRLLQLTGERPIVLASFGGHGAALPFEQIAKASDITLVVTDYEAASITQDSAFDGRLRRYSSEALAQADVGYEDLVAAADVVVTKPGYGIVSECIANQTALLYTSRGLFAENDVLVGGMQPFIRSRFIAQADLRDGDWEFPIRSLLNQAEPRGQMRLDGAEVVAREIVEVTSRNQGHQATKPRKRSQRL